MITEQIKSILLYEQDQVMKKHDRLLNIRKKLIRRIVEISHLKKTSHVGGALSVLDLLIVLYHEVIDVEKIKRKQADRDRVFFSKGHACTGLYSVLESLSFFNKSDLDSLTDNGSIFTSHVSHKVPGVELSTGSLGHALSVAAGVAYSAKIKNLDYHTYCILSDGELDEGSNWEAVMFASHHRLSNLTIIIDYNKIQSFGRVEDVINLEPLVGRFMAFGCTSLEIDGHSFKEIFDALMRNVQVGPKVIVANTVKGKGISYMEDKLEWHYKSPTDEELEVALAEIEKMS